ncbi:hypothetical protein [Butyrivibrio sp. AE3009]|uniref:hypothetical protein n=1 Tax=Butyrivibrio sp. AE3009 TaxID=1280666 RepID=UPI0003B6B262|nr:hypothetical protein [Butyrivibrio sp. AE3009]
MGSFRINISGCRQASQGFIGASTRLEALSRETEDIACELEKMPSFSELVPTVRGFETTIADESRKVQELKEAIDKILDYYTQAEDNILQYIRPSGGDQQAVIEGGGGTSKKSGNDLMQTDPAEMEKFISDFEKIHPEYAKAFEDFLKGGKNNNLTEDDIRNIKYLAYNAPEPYRSMFLNNLDKYCIVDCNYYTIDENGNKKPGACFNYTKGGEYGGLFYNPNSFEPDPRGPYTTLFHETGHCLDYNNDMCNFSGSDTETYTYYSHAMQKEVTLKEAIWYDVYDNPNNEHSVHSIGEQLQANNQYPAADLDKVVEAMKNGTRDSLPRRDKALYDKIVEEMKTNHITGGPLYEAPSDVYGGVSRNELRNGYGHDQDTYWGCDADGVKPGKELWAEYFSYQMAGDLENIEILKEYFPEASDMLEQYAKDMANN